MVPANAGATTEDSMGKEIERKFLVTSDAWRDRAGDGTRMRQGYIIGGSRGSVRIRIAGDAAQLNIKSATLGVERLEYEYDIPMADAEEMLDRLCQGPLIEKWRYLLAYGGLSWEVDVFEGDNAGLVVAEVELDHPNQPFEKPDWLGREVSHEPRYYNTELSKHPFRRWTEQEKCGD